MGISVSGQLTETLAALGLGFAGGFFYDILRAIRRQSRLRVVDVLLDILFWFVCAIGLFLFGLTLSGGKQRIFVFVFAFLGGWLYFAAVSRFTLFLCESLVELVRFVLICLSAPFVLTVSGVNKIYAFIRRKMPDKAKATFKKRRFPWCKNIPKTNE